MLVARWLGAAGLEVSDGESSVLIDPYVSRPGKLALLATRPRSKPAAVERTMKRLPAPLRGIAVSHTHFDHALDVPAFAARFDGPVIGSSSLDALLTAHGEPDRVTVCRDRTEVTLPGGAVVTMIPSQHGRVVLGRVPYAGHIGEEARPAMRASRYRLGDVFAIKVTMGGRSIIQLGSANFIDEELAGESCDALFVCVPGWKRTKNFHERLFAAVRTPVVVPFHFDDFTARWDFDGTTRRIPLIDMPRFLARLRDVAPETRVVIPRPFEALSFE